MYASFRSVTDKNSKILTPTRTGNFLLTSMDREFYTTDSLVKCICWKKQSTKEHTNNPAVSALPWSGTLSWDDDIIPSEWSAWNLVKGFDCFSIFFFFFVLQLPDSFPVIFHFSPFSVTVSYVLSSALKRKTWEGFTRGETERSKNFISSLAFFPSWPFSTGL